MNTIEELKRDLASSNLLARQGIENLVDSASVQVLYDDLNKDIEEADFDANHGFLTLNIARNGKLYFWYFDGDFNEAIEIGSNLIYTDDEWFEEQFC